MAKQKTTETIIKPLDYINSSLVEEAKKADSLQLLKLMKNWSGFEGKMWGGSIIGFGSYHYKYASGHEGDAPLLGFSPRKSAISLYIYAPTKENEKLLKELGKYKMGKACIYLKKLADADILVMEKISLETIKFLKERI